MSFTLDPYLWIRIILFIVVPFQEPIDGVLGLHPDPGIIANDQVRVVSILLKNNLNFKQVKFKKVRKN